jgi:3-deoxy-D-manno-octulosonic-acid transferase
MTAVRILYNLAFPFVLLALLPGFLFRMLKRGKYRHKFGQRFAVYSQRVRRKLSRGGWTWVHAVSVGEVLIALKLIRELRSRDPQLPVVLSTTTSTGYALASKETGDYLEAIYNPLDFFWTARRAIRLIRPRRLILVEAEVWPNLTAEAKARGATLALVNARLSRRSESRYRMIRPLAAPIFNQLDLLCVQEPADARRWEDLGVNARRILCTGSIKFDDRSADRRVRQDFRETLAKLGVAKSGPIILAGSTHSGEESLIGEIVIRLKQSFPDIFCVIVPRHVERWREVREQLEKLGLRVALRTNDENASTNADALLVNTTGELRDWYDQATVVFVGKSLTAHGGQNPAEAVAAGKPVVFGPNMENFSSLAAQLVREGGALQVPDAASLEEELRALLSDAGKRSRLAANGARCLEAHYGATARTCQALEGLESSRAFPKDYQSAIAEPH